METAFSGGDSQFMRLMIASVSLVAILFLSVFPSALASPNAERVQKNNKTRVAASVPGELILKLKVDFTNKSARVFAEIANDLGKKLGLKSAVKVRTLMTTTQYAVLTHISGNSQKAIAELKRDPRVAYAEPNYLYHSFGTTDATPNDPNFSQLWGMNNTGQLDPQSAPGDTQQAGSSGSDIHVLPVWNEGITGSKTIRVAIIDTGIDYTHPDLKDNVDASQGFNFVTNTQDALDDHNHGSHCSGTIGGVANNGQGITGVNWNVTMIPVKFLDKDGSGSADRALQAVQYATKIGVNVMSNSWGGGGFSQALMDAIGEARAKGILFVAAAGNSGFDNDTLPTYPASYALDNIVSVAASDNQDSIAGFSNYGLTSVHVSAPGVKILSTEKNGSYGVMSGTSMATPHVSGIAALMLSANPSLTYAEVKSALIKSCDPVRKLAHKVVCGGRVNVYNAIHGIYPVPSGPDPRAWKDVSMSIQSLHPYENAHTYDFPISVPNAKFIRVVFDSVDTEAGYDFIHVTQANGDEIELVSGTYTGYITDYLTGDHANLKLTSDSSINKTGFVVSRVQAIY
jgi:thermitase